MPSKPYRLRFAIVLSSLVAVAVAALAQQSNQGSSSIERRAAAAPRGRRTLSSNSLNNSSPQQQRPAAGAAHRPTSATRHAARASRAGHRSAARPAVPVRQAGGTEPLPPQGAQRATGTARRRAAAGRTSAEPRPTSRGANRAGRAVRPHRRTTAAARGCPPKSGNRKAARSTRSVARSAVGRSTRPSARRRTTTCTARAFGEIKYSSPDHGVYLVNKQTEWDPAKKVYVPRTEGLDHWVCNGKSIFEFNYKQKQLIERELAPEMQGKAITDGPLPFVFGTKADQLKQRYWMRDITPTDDVGKKVWLELHPKFQRDAANFHHAIIMLDQKTFLPSALRIVQPDGKNTQDYAFNNISKNNPLAVIAGAFDAPRKPFNWTKVVIPAGGDPPAAADQPPAQVQQPRAANPTAAGPSATAASAAVRQ